MKRSKQNYYKKHFESNLNNSKNTWKGIKSIKTMKNVISTLPRTLCHGENTTTNPCEIANVFNNYFAAVAETAKQNINYSHKYLKYQCNNTIFIQPTNSEEITNIISSLNINKVCGPFSIPNKILILLKQDISLQLADLFNLSFSSGSFPSILKTAKVVPVFKKGSKLDCCNYRPISLLSNVEKILENLMYKRVYNFLTENNIIYDLQFGFRQKFSASHALINLTENIRRALDEGYIGYWMRTCKKYLTLWIMKYCYLNLTTMVFEVYQIIGLNPTFLSQTVSFYKRL